MGEGEATRQKIKKKPKPKHVELGAAPSLLPAAPFLQTPTQSTGPGTPILEEEAMRKRKRKMRKEQKAAPPLAQNPTLEEEEEEEAVLATTTKKKKHKKRKPSPSPSTAAAAETPTVEQEEKVTKNKKREQSCYTYTPLPLDPGQAQAQGTNVRHASKRLPAAPFLEAPAPLLEEPAVMRKRKICKERKVAALSLAQNTALEVQREDDDMLAKMNKKDSKHMEAEVIKKQKQRKQQEPSGKSPLPPDLGQTHRVRSQGGKAPPEQEQKADGRKGSSIEKNNGTRPRVRVLSKRELIREGSKKPPALPQGFVPFSDFVASCTEQNPDHSSPHIAFFDQFRYNPVRKGHKPPIPRTPDRLASLPSRGHLSFASSQLTANETSKAFKSNSSVASKTKQKDSAPEVDNIKKSNGKKAHVRGPSKGKLFKEMSKEQMLPEGFLAPARKSKKKDSGSGSASGSKEKLNAAEKKNHEKQREPLLTRAEMCSDKYRRVPLDKLVQPPRSPHHLLQENYASDPWKVIVICMLLNLTQGKQVKKIVEGFFECYPDPHAAINADFEKMAGYLTPLGLQHRKTTRIQTFSKQYVENDWNYITELCGVGKYAADAYAIFCAGRATEVVPKDHKLVAYWKYVRFELPGVQGSQSVQEAGVTDQELAVIC